MPPPGWLKSETGRRAPEKAQERGNSVALVSAAGPRVGIKIRVYAEGGREGEKKGGGGVGEGQRIKTNPTFISKKRYDRPLAEYFTPSKKEGEIYKLEESGRKRTSTKSGLHLGDKKGEAIIRPGGLVKKPGEEWPWPRKERRLQLAGPERNERNCKEGSPQVWRKARRILSVFSLHCRGSKWRRQG